LKSPILLLEPKPEGVSLILEAENQRGYIMATQKQRAAATKNIKKATAAAKRKQTLKRLPKKTRQALGQQAAKARRAKS